MTGWGWRIRMGLGGAMLGACLSGIITGAENIWWCGVGFFVVLLYSSHLDKRESAQVSGK